MGRSDLRCRPVAPRNLTLGTDRMPLNFRSSFAGVRVWIIGAQVQAKQPDRNLKKITAVIFSLEILVWTGLTFGTDLLVTHLKAKQV